MRGPRSLGSWNKIKVDNLMRALDFHFKDEGDLYRITPAVWVRACKVFPIRHWHEGSSRFKERWMKDRKVGVEGRIDGVFLCPELTYHLGALKLRTPGLYVYLN